MIAYIDMRRLISLTALILGLFLIVQPNNLQAQDTVQLSVSDSRIVAQRALNARDYPVAMGIAGALLQRDPNDLQALLIMAAGHLAMGQNNIAFKFAKRAYSVAPAKNPNRFGAATVAARSLARDKKFERAKFWMRRAIQLAPSEKAEAVRIKEFRNIRSASPWRNNASFSVQPSDNVNNGTSEKFINLGGLEFTLNDTEPLTGLKASLSFDIAYQLAKKTNRNTYIGLDFYNREVIVTGENNTSLEGSDFRYTYGGIYLNNIRSVHDKSLIIRDKLSFGTTWYGGDQLNNRLAVSRSYRKTIDPKTALGLYVRLAKTVNQSDPIKNSTSINVAPSYTRSIENVGIVRLSPFVSKVKSDSSSTANKGYGLSLNYRPHRDIFKTSASFTLGIGARRDSLIGFSGVKREDEYLSLRANFFVKNFTFFGFSPTINIEARRNRSNITIFDTESLGFGIGFRSAF